MSDIKDLQARAYAIRTKYNALNKKHGHHAWTGKDYAMGFVGDVGDLAKLVMAKENMRTIDNADAKLKHELGDCLWSLMVIAEHYNIDLAKAFLNTMGELEARIGRGQE